MENQTLPAFPCVTQTDNFGRIIVPVPGMTKKEYLMMQLLCTMVKNKPTNDKHDISYIVAKVDEITNVFFEQLNNKENVQNQPKITL
jgi:hypothetical protein